MKARNYMPAVGTYGAKWYPEDIVGYPQMTTGDYYFVDAAKSADGGGKSWDDAFADLDSALTAVSDGDVIYIAPGTYTGNYVTQKDNEAQNVAIIGVSPSGRPSWNSGVILAPTTGTSPALTIKASGYRVSNICFKPGTTSSGITLYADMSTANYLTGTVGSLCRGGTIDNCLFWGNSTGKYGIIAQGVTGTQAPNGWQIMGNKFIYLAATAASGIWFASGGNPCYDWNVEGNMFESCRAGIDTYAAMGLVGSRIMDNSFGIGGTYSSATTCLVDVTATATPAVTGGNHFYRNGLGCTKAQAAAGTYVLLNGYDNAGGNYCSDGIDTGIYKAS